MANGNIKGITIELNGDTTKLGNAIKDVSSESIGLQGELKKVDRLLKFDPGNAELIAQKQQILAQNVEATSKKLETLKRVQEQVNAQFAKGDISAEQYRAFQREVIKTESALNGLKTKLSEVNSSSSKIDKLKSGFKEVARSAKDASKEIATALGAAGTAGAAAVGGLVTGMQEYNQDLGRLKTNASMAGRDLKSVEDAFKQITAVTGETDSAVETVSNLLATGFKDNQLAPMIDQINGAAIRFSDTLKTEGIADGIQETFATGEAVGQFGELLERSGVDLESFNGKLQQAQKEGKGTEFIMQTMADLGFGAVTEKYKEMNPEVQANAEAQVNLQKALSDLSIVLTPLVTKVTEIVTSFINWAKENPQLASTIATIGSVMAVVVGVFAALSPVVSVIANLLPVLKIAFTALTGPIGIVIAIITALIAIGVALYKNWDEVSKYASIAWEAIKSAISTAWDAIKSVTMTVWNAIKSFLNSLWEGIKSIATTIWDGLKTYFTTLLNVYKTLFTTSWNAIQSVTTTVFNAIKTFLSTLWEGIKTSITTIVNGIKTVITTVWNAIKSTTTTIFNGVKTVISDAWNAVKNITSTIVNGVKSTVSNIFTNMKTAIANTMSNIKTTISNIWGNVMAFFQGINLSSIGKNIIEGLISGITSMATKVVDSVKGVVNGAIDAAKNLLGIHSPSRVFMEIGEFTNEGFIKGIQSTTSQLMSAMDNVYGSLGNSVEGMTRSNNNYSSNRSYDYSRRMTNQITVNASKNESRDLERLFRRLAFEF